MRKRNKQPTTVLYDMILILSCFRIADSGKIGRNDKAETTWQMTETTRISTLGDNRTFLLKVPKLYRAIPEGSRKSLKMSESQWPNKKEDYELKDVIGRLTRNIVLPIVQK